MSYRLNLDWEGDLNTVSELEIHLLPLSQGLPQAPIQAQFEGRRHSFRDLTAGPCLLALRYSLQAERFDSFYFELEVPDITLIKLKLQASGAQIEQMGFLNDYGEFVDMLIYANEKPWLTRPLADHALLKELSDFLVFDFAHCSAAQARERLNTLLGSLDQAFPELELLWPYQLKKLLQPALLAQTSAEWKACLLHLLRNDLMLMDHEGLYEQLQEAMELSQQQDQVDILLRDLEWNPDTGSWNHYQAFLQNLKHKTLLAST